MSNIKKMLVMVVCMLIVAMPAVFAQQMMGKDGKMGTMGMREGMMGMGSGMKMWNKMDFEQMFNYKVSFILMNSKDLGVTDEQMMKIKDLKYRIEKSLIMKKAEIEATDIDIMQAFGKDDIDVMAIGKLIDKKYDAKKMQAKELVDACATLRMILTTDQQKKIKDMWSAHMTDGMKKMMKDRMMGKIMDDYEEQEIERESD